MKSKKAPARRKNMGNMLLCAPLIAWIGALIVIPLAYLLYMSFQTKGPMGTVVYKFTLENYAKIFEAEYFTVLKKSVWIALISTFACVALGYPLAFFIASKRSQASGILMLMLMVPFWTCVLVTIYSFVILFAREGLLNSLLLWLGITKEPMDLLYNDFSVSVGMVYMLLPFAAMPMYASIEKLDQSLIEASKDLGAGRIRTFVKVVLPLTRPGIFAAVILTFIPCIGYYMITDMLGGGTTMLIGNIIYNQFTSARNWPFGAALSCLLAAAILIMMFAYTKTGGDLDDLGG